MPFGSERSTVQDPLIRYACEAGWQPLSPEDALRMRGGEGGLLLQQVFLTQAQRLNPGIVDHARRRPRQAPYPPFAAH